MKGADSNPSRAKKMTPQRSNYNIIMLTFLDVYIKTNI